MAAASRESDTARTTEVAPQTDSNAVSDLRPHSMPPSAAEINQSSAGAQQAAQEAINKQFGPLTITDTGAAKLCDKLDQAPKDAHSIGVNPETGAKQGFIWQNGHGYALSTDGKGRADVCVEYANGTKVGMTGEMVTNPTPGGMPIKPDKVEVLSNGGKMQFEKAPDGSTIMHATDPLSPPRPGAPEAQPQCVVMGYQLRHHLLHYPHIYLPLQPQQHRLVEV